VRSASFSQILSHMFCQTVQTSDNNVHRTRTRNRNAHEGLAPKVRTRGYTASTAM